MSSDAVNVASNGRNLNLVLTNVLILIVGSICGVIWLKTDANGQAIHNLETKFERHLGEHSALSVERIEQMDGRLIRLETKAEDRGL